MSKPIDLEKKQDWKEIVIGRCISGQLNTGEEIFPTQEWLLQKNAIEIIASLLKEVEREARVETRNRFIDRFKDFFLKQYDKKNEMYVITDESLEQWQVGFLEGLEKQRI